MEHSYSTLWKPHYRYNGGDADNAYLFQDGVIWAIHTQLPDLVVIRHNEKRFFT